jgi:hypothetical protein
VTISDNDLEFVRTNARAAMITIGADGYAKAVRMAVGVIDGKLWSSGTQDRARTKRLRKDPRCTLFVFDNEFSSLTLETTVNVLDGSDAPELNLRLFRHMQQKPSGPLSWFGSEHEEADFLDMMRNEGRLIYEFDVHRAYGIH